MKKFIKSFILLLCLALAFSFVACERDNETREQALDKVNAAIEKVNSSGAIDSTFIIASKMAGVTITVQGLMKMRIDGGVITAHQTMTMLGSTTSVYFVNGYVCTAYDSFYDVMEMNFDEFMGGQDRLFMPINDEDIKEWSKSKKDNLTSYTFELDKLDTLGVASDMLPGLAEVSDLTVSVQTVLDRNGDLNSQKYTIKFKNGNISQTFTVDMVINATGEVVEFTIPDEVTAAVNDFIDGQTDETELPDELGELD